MTRYSFLLVAVGVTCAAHLEGCTASTCLNPQPEPPGACEPSSYAEGQGGAVPSPTSRDASVGTGGGAIVGAGGSVGTGGAAAAAGSTGTGGAAGAALTGDAAADASTSPDASSDAGEPGEAASKDAANADTGD